jgi:LacI family transcriptional regulator
MSKKVNIKTIASELGVSPSTVSKALKDSHEISLETRKKIQAYAKFYNYKPNSLALGLRNQKTMVIGVIVPELVHHFFSRVISGIEKVANENDYNLMICLSNDKLQKEKQNIDMLTNGSVDGLLVSVAKESFEKEDYDHFNRLIAQDFPIVFFDRVPAKLNVDKVIVDDIAGGYKAANHLIERGYKKLAILTTPTHINVGTNREKGFTRALQENGLKIYPKFDIKIDEKFEIAPQIERLFDQDELPDGIFAVNETYAACALKIAQKKGLEVPKELAIIGFTDGLISKTTNPTMSTVAQHGYTMGSKAAEILLERIFDKKKLTNHQTTVISTNVVEREST